MVSTTGVTSQSYVQQQPTFSSGTEARANTEQVQPREAPPANTQRTDRKVQSRDDDRKQAVSRQNSQAEEAASSSRRQEGRRGSLVDVSV